MRNSNNRMFNKPVLSVIATAILVCGIQSARAEAFNWEGPYAGLSMGAQKTKYDWKTTDWESPFGGPMLPGFAEIGGNPKESLESNDFLFDLFGGYNWAVAPQVILGAEAHARYAHAGDTQKVPGVNLNGVPAPDSGVTSVEAKTNWSGDIRGRLGYLVQSELLVYTTAGVAYTQLDTTVTCPPDTNVCYPIARRNSDSQNAFGWLAGIGLETSLTDNLTARIEYLYTDYGTVDVDGLPPKLEEASFSFGFNGDVDLTTQALSAGLAYKF